MPAPQEAPGAHPEVQIPVTASDSVAPDKPLRVGSLAEKYGLLVAVAVIFTVFSALNSATYFTPNNISAMLGSQAVLVVITMGMIISLRAGDADLSTASVLTLAANVIAIMNVDHQIGVGWAVLVAVGLGGIIGFLNGIMCVFFKIDSFIITLGTGTVLQGVILWISEGRSISGISDALVSPVITWRLMNIPAAFYYGLVLCAIVWYVFEHTSIGTQLLFVGKNRDVAILSGIRVSVMRVGALTTTGLVSALAGVIFAGTLGSSDPASGLSYLLPAFAAAFLGATSIRPGRFNAWGSFAAVYFLIFGITGLAINGAPTFVQPIFYGGALVIAVVVSQLVSRRRQTLTIMG